jgi:hypothetical protein
MLFTNIQPPGFIHRGWFNFPMDLYQCKSRRLNLFYRDGIYSVHRYHHHIPTRAVGSEHFSSYNINHPYGIYLIAIISIFLWIYQYRAVGSIHIIGMELIPSC